MPAGSFHGAANRRKIGLLVFCHRCRDADQDIIRFADIHGITGSMNFRFRFLYLFDPVLINIKANGFHVLCKGFRKGITNIPKTDYAYGHVVIFS